MKRWSELGGSERDQLVKDMANGMLIEQSAYGQKWYKTDKVGQSNLYYRSSSLLETLTLYADDTIIGEIDAINGQIVTNSIRFYDLQ
jgi:hypothetical protein